MLSQVLEIRAFFHHRIGRSPGTTHRNDGFCGRRAAAAAAANELARGAAMRGCVALELLVKIPAQRV